MPETSDSLESAISAAYDGGNASAETQPAETVPEPVETSAPEPREESEAPEARTEETQPAEREKKPTARDAQGKFAKPPAPSATPAPVPEALKPPADWKPQARAKWGELPPEVQQEAIRTHLEVKKVLQSTAEARKVAEGFERTIQPYRAFIQGEPLQVVGNLFQTAVRLQTGTPAQKAGLVAELIGAYGVDVEHLVAALEGKAPTQQAQQPAEFRDPRFDQFLGQLQQQQQQRAAQSRAQMAQEVATFAEAHEFFQDVREDMADVLERASKQGKRLTMEQAYERACMLNEDVRPLYEQRKSAQAAANAPRASTQTRTRVTSSSLRNEPSLPSAGKPKSLDADIEAAWDTLSKGP